MNNPMKWNWMNNMSKFLNCMFSFQKTVTKSFYEFRSLSRNKTLHNKILWISQLCSFKLIWSHNLLDFFVSRFKMNSGWFGQPENDWRITQWWKSWECKHKTRFHAGVWKLDGIFMFLDQNRLRHFLLKGLTVPFKVVLSNIFMQKHVIY